MVHHVKDQADFKSKLEEAGAKLVLVDFHATWCGPCKNISPFVDTLFEELKDKLVVLKIDVDEVEELAVEYAVNSMPTFIFIKNKVKVDQLVGANTTKLRDLVTKHL